MYGLDNTPALPSNYTVLHTDDEVFADQQHESAMLTKAFEISTGARNPCAQRALQVPSYLRDIFTVLGEVSKRGDITLRHAVFRYLAHWDELGMPGECPIEVSDEKVHQHLEEWKRYCEYQNVVELAKRVLGTDDEGHIDHNTEFQSKYRENEVLMREVMRRSHEFNMSADQVQRIWPCKKTSRFERHISNYEISTHWWYRSIFPNPSQNS